MEILFFFRRITRFMNIFCCQDNRISDRIFHKISACKNLYSLFKNMIYFVYKSITKELKDTICQKILIQGLTK